MNVDRVRKVDYHAGVPLCFAGTVRAVKSDLCVNCAGWTAIADLPALYALSACMITNDSGTAHFASVTSSPVLVLFCPETPKLYGPLGTMTPLYADLACSPCINAANHRKTACNDNICLQVLSAEQVYQAIKPSMDSLGSFR